MVVLAALVWLPWRAVLAIGVVIVAGHNLLDPIRAENLGALAMPWALLHQQAPILVGGKLAGFVVYPLLAWIGVMAFGYGLGPFFLLPQAQRRRALTLTGAALVVLFVGLRAADGYGDPGDWSAAGGTTKAVMTFLATTKSRPHWSSPA